MPRGGPARQRAPPGGRPDAGRARRRGRRPISVGGTFAWNALSALVTAARELLAGDVEFLDRTGSAREVMPRAFGV
ncbi:hypothetical protein [Isoptericola variabilis]|uniref:hypothetical protein n=1 Tax=Isoptericola variabilis TaxID=139208 RepID=UPI00031682F9|nr:hypothetical protein [Isoptericola variabilis]